MDITRDSFEFIKYDLLKILAEELLIYPVKVNYGNISSPLSDETNIEFMMLASDEIDRNNVLKVLNHPKEIQILESIIKNKIGNVYKISSWRVLSFEGKIKCFFFLFKSFHSAEEESDILQIIPSKNSNLVSISTEKHHFWGGNNF
jgi:hypothetical protein